MVIVIASARIKAGQRDTFISLFKEFAESVRQEKGCIEYFPSVDLETGSPIQDKDPNVVTVIERWESLQDLQTHMQTPEFKAFGEKSAPYTEGMSAKILEAA